MSVSFILLMLTALFAGVGIGRATFGVIDGKHQIILQGIVLITVAIALQLLSISLSAYALWGLNHVTP